MNRTIHRQWRPVLAMCLLLAAILMVCAPPTAAQADEPLSDVQILGISQQDRNRDGAPDLTIIRCTIETPEDRVLVYDGAGNMHSSANWEEATDFTDDTWVFQIGGSDREHTRLIVTFSTEGSNTVAHVYDGSATGGLVRYVLAGPSVQVIEPAYPTMIIRATGGWVYPDGTLNYNLSWQCDGPIMNWEHAERYPRAFVLDGNPEAEGEVRDANRDGVPEYLWYTLLASVPASEGISRSSAQVNSGRYRPANLTHVVFWPLLSRPDNPSGGNYFDTPLFLGMDWESGMIQSFSFRGYPIEEGYHINSSSALKRGRVNSLQFENPMAYYDLAQDRDGRPELFIRMAYTPPGDPFFISGGPTNFPFEMVQYSWNQQNHNALLWDYKLDLAGTNPLSRTVSLGEMVMETVPHDELPGWVADKSWGFATLVAYETGQGYQSSEGIYEWSTLEGVEDYTSGRGTSGPHFEQIQRDYLAGVSSQSLAKLYQTIPEGYRGEYAEINGKAWLYFSPVDARLHLVGATWGVYSSEDGHRLEYHNLDGDAFIDTWRLFVDNEPVAQLQQSRHFLLLSQGEQVTLRPTNLPPQIFRTQQPTQHAEWVSLSAQLTAYRRDLAPDDLEAMSQASDEPAMTIHRATLSAYRPLAEDGFRFVLELQPGFFIEGVELLPLSQLESGNYLVTYQGELIIEPLTPTQLTISPLPKGLLLDSAVEFHANTIGLYLSNTGLQDATDVLLKVTASETGTSTIVDEREVTVLAGETTRVALPWSPPHAGEWTIQVTAWTSDGERGAASILAEYEEVIQVAQAPLPSLQQTLSAFGLVPSPMIFGLFVSALVLSGAGLAYLLRLGAAEAKDTDGWRIE